MSFRHNDVDRHRIYAIITIRDRQIVRSLVQEAWFTSPVRKHSRLCRMFTMITHRYRRKVWLTSMLTWLKLYSGSVVMDKVKL